MASDLGFPRLVYCCIVSLAQKPCVTSAIRHLGSLFRLCTAGFEEFDEIVSRLVEHYANKLIISTAQLRRTQKVSGVDLI